MLDKFPGSINRQMALAIQLNNEATFADFNWGDNLLLQQQISSALEAKGERLFTIWGASGSGKSHLLQACCQASEGHAVYLPLQILKEWGPQSIEGLAQQSLIAIDDIEVIAGILEWEEAIFHLYNQVRDEGRSVLIISSQHPPAATSIQLADLRSRLAWGLVIQLVELSDNLKINSLQQQALKRGFELPVSVAQFLINRCARNMHDLARILNLLDHASLAAQRKITVPFVKAILGI